MYHPLGTIEGSDIIIYTDDTATEFFVNKTEGMVALTLPQLRIVHDTRGIRWADERVGAQMEEFLTGAPAAPLQTEQYQPSRQTLDDIEVAGQNSIFDGRENVYIGDFRHQGRILNLGFQNSTGAFFFFDESKNKMDDITADTVQLMAKNRNGIQWVNEEMREQVYGLLDLRYTGPRNEQGYTDDTLMKMKFAGWGSALLGLILPVAAMAVLFLNSKETVVISNLSDIPAYLKIAAALGAFGSLSLAGSMLLSIWMIFLKVGEKGWKSLVPIYSTILLLKMVGRPWWWLLLTMVPLLGLVVMLLLFNDLSRAFGKSIGFTVGIALLPMIFLPLLAFGSAPYGGPNPTPFGNSSAQA